MLADSQDGGSALAIEPLLSAASERPRKVGYGVWQAMTAAMARRPRAEALAYLDVMIVLAERLGGPAALRAIDKALVRAVDWWP